MRRKEKEEKKKRFKRLQKQIFFFPNKSNNLFATSRTLHRAAHDVARHVHAHAVSRARPASHPQAAGNGEQEMRKRSRQRRRSWGGRGASKRVWRFGRWILWQKIKRGKGGGASIVRGAEARGWTLQGGSSRNGGGECDRAFTRLLPASIDAVFTRH